ncbi:hypothetical protein [Runella slithyformis]|uniref:Uncharacterized protein n=1 Tax=Runella slithyformis (strain ATCC 29530 / DSM 19594 / LMG 11500 / NCIMB 11436 / LSU 4) TaxID=761193 RepID=A0A7U3ZN39_RUNSL|nr:hypothetical protein [Runella slithyformis]AEI50260.1 hypothetical protein Runsl_3904 [Runella slithyformis DSM 19594]
MSAPKITFNIVKRLYPLHQIKGVNEAWKEGIGWFKSANGQNINEQGTAEQQILFCKAIGATSVQLYLEVTMSGLTHKVYADYKMADLIE